MSKELVISATPHETRVAIVEDGLLCEIYIEREKEFALVGSLYKGRVTRVLPGMQSAFVDIGLDSDAFLYVSDFLENLEEYDHVEPKVQPQRPPAPEVFAPSTTGGVPAGAGAPVEAAAQEQFAPLAADNDPVDVAPAAEAAPPAAPQENVRPAPPPQQRNQRPYEQRPNRGGQGGGFGGRGGGRNRRWGGRQGGGGGRDRRPPGRDLPPSKYASSRPPDSQPREATPYEPPPADYTPIILPGESLAKYKDRVPGAPAAPSAAPPSDVTSDAGSQTAAPEISHRGLHATAGLPGSLYATPSAAIPPAAPPVEEHTEPVAELPPVPHAAHSEEVDYAQPFLTPPVNVSEESAKEIAQESLEAADRFSREPDFTDEPDVLPQAGPVLSEDEMSSLSEQLSEAKHEEAQAVAEDRDEAMDTSAAPFVEEAELEDLQEALHEDHEADADDAEAAADEMHDAAMADELSPGNIEDHGEGHLEEHAGEHIEGQPEDHLEEHPDGNRAGDAPQHSESQPSSARISDQPRARFQRPMRRGGNRNRGGRRGPSHDNRPRQNSPQRPQHKRPQLISEMLKAGQEIIVQIAKEPLGKKGARITSHVALPGRFLVYMPTVDHIGVSHRIGSAEDRSRLRRLVNEAKGTFPGGFIVRTAAAGASDEEIRTDVEFLGRTWDSIRAGSEQRHAPSLLHRDLNLVQRILRDYISDDYVAVWIDNEEEYSKVVEFISRFQPRLVGRVKLYTKESPIFEEFGIQQELDKALRPKVWLKSGGYIVINHTEALVAIDVNTGKYVGRGSTRLEDTIVKTNLEAVKEIVRQIRLRDLGGIIVLDLIDMEERRNRDKVLAALEQALSEDRAPSKALAFNEFGLVCVTRKRTKQALERVLCQPCPYCTGSGMVKSIPTICYEIQTEARKMSADLDSRSLTLRVNPEIAKSLKTRESSLIEELEQATRKSVIIQSDPTLHWEQYDIY